jgi:predicted RNA-binding protein with PIN domain
LSTEPLVLVDGENVRRSRWPNLSPDELVQRACAWARRNDVRVVVVFDGGRAGERFVDGPCAVVHTGGEIADDWIARRAAELQEEGRRYWLVTSDRELRVRAGGGAERVLGGGGFLGQLT